MVYLILPASFKKLFTHLQAENQNLVQRVFRTLWRFYPLMDILPGLMIDLHDP